jgi:hypothetical protein
VQPPVDVILRRRHLVLVLVRSAAVVVAVFGAVDLAMSLLARTERITDFSLFEYRGAVIAAVLLYGLPALVIGLVSRRLSRWIVPAGLRSDACMNCGYSLKNLKSPICPECGADVKRG